MSTMAKVNSRVLIVGAGPTGLTAALSLAQNGVPIRIIDSAVSPQVGERGASLQPRVFELFSILGVADDILKEAALLQPPLFHDLFPVSHPIAPERVPWQKEPSPDIPYPNFLMLGQDRTEAILREHLVNRYHIQVEYGTTLVDFEQNENGVTVHLQDSHGDESMSVGWLIGADGPKSSIRKHLGINYIGETRNNQKFITGDVHVQRGFDRRFSHRWGKFTSKGVGMRPCERYDDTLVNFIIGGSDIPYSELMSNHQALLDYIINTTGLPDLQFGDLVCVDDWRPNIRMADKFSQGRVFIAGDAAHIHCTSGGQGIVSCVQDAMNLCWKIALVERGISSSTLLDTYDEERRPVIKDMLSITTTTFDQIVMGKLAPWPKSVSDLRQFSVNYRWSSIVVDDIPAANPVGTYNAPVIKPQAGDRAPEAPGLVNVNSGMTTSVFGMLGSCWHTVLVFADTADQAIPYIDDLERAPKGSFKFAIILPQSTILSPAVQLSEDVVYLNDSDNHAHTSYLPGEGRRVVAIRPDGVIGAMTGGCLGLRKYLDLILVATEHSCK